MNSATTEAVSPNKRARRTADAINNPTSMPAKELHTSDLKVGQRPAIDMGDGFEDREAEVIQPVYADIGKKYMEDSAFAEEPVTIQISASSEKNPPKVVDCWVNGKGAEVFMNGKWHILSYLPIGQQITTRRKYVEVLARSKPDSVQTNVVERDGEDPENQLTRSTSSKYPFSVIEDRNPAGAAWLRQILMEG